MKKALALIISGLVLATGAQAEVKIGGKNTQKVTVENGAIANMAFGASTAKQNIASNKGKVDIKGDNNQQVSVKNGAIANMAFGASKAEQNVASNEGN